MLRYLDYYLSVMKIAILQQLQYRVANYFFLFGLAAESVIYLVVWSTVAKAEGGSVGGYGPGDFAAYYIAGILVNTMNIALSPYSWEWRVQRGQLSGELRYPIHPLHNDIAYYAGSNLLTAVLSIPVAVLLAVVFKPVLAFTWYQAIAFLLAICGAYLISTIVVSLLGMITFWTTRVGAVFELFFALELLLSGRLVPIPLMPAWVQQLIGYLPFQWGFYFPVEALVGRLSPNQLLYGLAMQAAWILAGFGLVNFVWRLGIRRYTAVGN